MINPQETQVAAVGVSGGVAPKGKRSIASYGAPAVTLLLVVVVWEIVTATFKIPGVILPSPVEVWNTLVHNFATLMANTIPTIEETALGFLLSVVIALPLGVLLATNRLFAVSVYPLVIGAQTIPKVAIAPLFVIWMGFGILPKILITFLVAFFPVVISTAAGLDAIPADMRDLGRMLRLRPGPMFWRIQFPYALPQIFSGLKVAMTLAVIGAIVGEFVGANTGLGYLLMAANGNFNTPLMFADLVVLTVLGVLFYMLVDVAEGLAIPWHVSRRIEK